MRSVLSRLRGSKSGATAIEYALIASLVSLALFGGLSKYYGAINGTYNAVLTNLNNTNSTN